MIFPKDLPSPRAQLALSVFLEVDAAIQLTSHGHVQKLREPQFAQLHAEYSN